MEMTEKVRQIINGISPISRNSFNAIAELLTLETYNKGDAFIRRNSRNEKEYFILNGICKSYLINPDGDEVTLSFFLKNSVLSPYSTRISGNLSTHNFKALTDLELASINAGDFQELMMNNHEIRNFGQAVLQLELHVKVKKEMGMASYTAKERLTEFRKDYKGLENLIAHTDIASYLGITNISLSRLRKDLSI